MARRARPDRRRLWAVRDRLSGRAVALMRRERHVGTDSVAVPAYDLAVFIVALLTFFALFCCFVGGLAILCPARFDENADWSETRAGERAVGQCGSGFAGTPMRICQMNGAWNSTVVSPCHGTHSCFIEAVSDANLYTVVYDNCLSDVLEETFFPPAVPGDTSNGTCPDGYRESDEGPPIRQCYANGTWADTFENPCVFSAHFSMFFADGLLMVFFSSYYVARQHCRSAVDEQDVRVGHARLEGCECYREHYLCRFGRHGHERLCAGQ